MLFTTYALHYQWPTYLQETDYDTCWLNNAGKHANTRQSSKTKPEPVRKSADSSPLSLQDKEKVNEILNNIEWTPTSVMGKLVQPKLIPATLTEEQLLLLSKLAEDEEFNYVPDIKKAVNTEAEEREGFLAQMERMGKHQRVRLNQDEKITVMNKAAMAALVKKMKKRHADRAMDRTGQEPDGATKEVKSKEKVPPKSKRVESTPSKSDQKYANYNYYKEGPHHQTWQNFKCFCYPTRNSFD